MKTRLACYLITLLGTLAQQPAAYAHFHLMQIEQVIGGVNGDTTAQAIQLRMRANGQNITSDSKLVVFDAAGLNPITVLNLSSNVANGATGDRVLIASMNFPTKTRPVAVPDFMMTRRIPASYLAAGSLAFESDTGIVYWRLSWGGGAYTGPNSGNTANDMDGNFGPPFGGVIPSNGARALQFQGSATDKSTSNAADYLRTADAAVFFNNAGARFVVRRQQSFVGSVIWRRNLANVFLNPNAANFIALVQPIARPAEGDFSNNTPKGSWSEGVK